MQTSHGARVALVDQIFFRFDVVVEAGLRESQAISNVSQGG